MKLTSSLFTTKIVEEELEEIQKALMFSHNYYVSQGRYSDALKITSLLAELQDEDGCLYFEERNPVISKDSVQQNTTNEANSDNWTELLGREQSVDEALESFFQRMGKYNLEKLALEKL